VFNCRGLENWLKIYNDMCYRKKRLGIPFWEELRGCVQKAINLKFILSLTLLKQYKLKRNFANKLFCCDHKNFTNEFWQNIQMSGWLSGGEALHHVTWCVQACYPYKFACSVYATRNMNAWWGGTISVLQVLSLCQPNGCWRNYVLGANLILLQWQP
jgi:hypothetical protein